MEFTLSFSHFNYDGEGFMDIEKYKIDYPYSLNIIKRNPERIIPGDAHIIHMTTSTDTQIKTNFEKYNLTEAFKIFVYHKIDFTNLVYENETAQIFKDAKINVGDNIPNKFIPPPYNNNINNYTWKTPSTSYENEKKQLKYYQVIVGDGLLPSNHDRADNEAVIISSLTNNFHGLYGDLEYRKNTIDDIYSEPNFNNLVHHRLMKTSDGFINSDINMIHFIYPSVFDVLSNHKRCILFTEKTFGHFHYDKNSKIKKGKVLLNTIPYFFFKNENDAKNAIQFRIKYDNDHDTNIGTIASEKIILRVELRYENE